MGHPSGGEIVAEALERQGVAHVFTLCGGHIAPILVGCKARGIRVIDVRHEANAVFAADAMARLTGTPGVAVVTAGPGVTNTVTAVVNARAAESPVILLGGATGVLIKGRGALQDIDQLSLIRTQVKWATTVRRLKDLGPAVAEACRQAKEGIPGPVFVECPVDLLYDEQIVRDWYLRGLGKGGSLQAFVLRSYVRWRLSRMFATGTAGRLGEAGATEPSGPDAARVEKAAARLATAKRPVMIVGSQTLCEPAAAAEIAAAVEALGIPTYLSGMARGLLGRAHPLQLRHKRREALRECDLVILAGVPCDFRLDYGRQISRKATILAANLNRRQLRLNRRPDVGLVAAPGRFLRALASEAPAHSDAWGEWHAQLRQRDAARDDEIATDAAQGMQRVNPLQLFKEIEAMLPDRAVLIGDGGDFVATGSYVLRPRAPLSWLDPGPFGTLGVGAGFAMSTALAHDGAEVWLFYGDGAAGFSLMEFDTFVRHRLPVIAVVGNDAGWWQIAREQVEILKDDVATKLERTDYHTVAEGLGGRGLLLARDDDIVPVLEEARRIAQGGTPVLINAQLAVSEFRKGAVSM
jgi:thiamine pyrophosphate-dependent acetolactate synthase large subunit-like protein